MYLPSFRANLQERIENTIVAQVIKYGAKSITVVLKVNKLITAAMKSDSKTVYSSFSDLRNVRIKLDRKKHISLCLSMFKKCKMA